MRGVLLQVRLDSTRLPGKALLKLGDKTLIEHAMLSCKRIDADIHAIVTTEDSILQLKPLAEKCDFKIFTGSKNDVLQRYIDAINHFKLDQFVRATGDNPLVSYELANILINTHNTLGNDYSGFLNNPVGTGVEVVNSNVLLEAGKLTKRAYDREHVTPYLYNNKERYRVFQYDAPEAYLFPDSYVTIDTPEDYNRIVKLFHELYHGEIITIESVIKWLKQEQLSYTPI